MIAKLGYRDDIDGLRAIAVLSVVFYHAGLGFPGGYVGVDVFFVISGYLITALIVKDLERGSFSMAIFWERRIRRIFPALAAMVTVTCIAGWFLLLPEDLAKLGASVIAQSLLVSNFYFWRTTNYFGGTTEEKPLLHTWSLAVEEQFYLIFPIALMAIWAFFNYRLKKREECSLTTECTENTERSAGLRLSKPSGAAFSNPSTSELARDSENTSLNRSAIGPASLQATSNPLRATESLCDATPSTLHPRPSTHLGDSRRWALFWIFAAVALLSFGLSIWGVKAQPFAAFFLLPTRAWELLLGSMLAVLPATVVVRNAALREILCLAGLAAIFVPVFFYGEHTPFPGLAALPPCLGTSALIWANSHSSGASKRGWIVKVLSWKPIVLIGLISYSLYLWHWPVICFTSYWVVAAFNIFERWGMVGVSFVLALISWKLVETPCRYRLQNKSHTIISILGSTLLLSLGYLYIFFNGFPERMPEQAQAFLKEIAIDAQKRKEYSHISRNFTNLDQLETGKLSRIGEEKIDSPDFILLGDSHAQCMVPVFDSFAKKHGISGLVVTYQGTPPFKSWPHQFDVAPQNADLIFEKVNKFISKNGVKNVFLSAYWSNYLRHGGIVDFSQALEESVRELQNNGAQVWFILDYPENEHNPIRSYLRNTFFPTASQFFACHAPPCFSKHWGKNLAVKKIANRLQTKLIDSSENLYDSKKNLYYVVKDGRPIYFDKDHLTIFGAEKSLGAKLDTVFSEFGYETPK